MGHISRHSLEPDLLLWTQHSNIDNHPGIFQIQSGISTANPF